MVFGAFPVICSIHTERTVEAGMPKLIDIKGKAVCHIILACRYRKKKQLLLAEQFRGAIGK